MSETFNLANQQFKTSKFEDAIINYKNVLKNSKSNDEKYISCLRIHESFYKMNKEQDGIYYLIEGFKYDEKRIECMYKLIVFYNINGSPNISLSFYSLIQDYYENKFINDYENILKKPDVKIDEYIFYLPYFMIIISHKLNKPEIAIKMFEIIFKYKYIDSGEWWLNNLFHNFILFINRIKNENLFKEFEIYLNLIYVSKKYNLNLERLNTICNYGINFGLNYKNIKYLNNNKLKILFHMSDNRPIKKYSNINDASYNGLAAVINYEYCKKYGYDFKYYVPYLNQLEPLNLYNCLDPNNDQPRHASWSKLLASQVALDSEENYDYIVYLDSDCIVKNFDIPLESIIYGNENKNMIFFWDRPCTHNEPNAGVYICKNNFNTKRMIEEWYNVNIPYQNINRIWEQSALWKVYKGWQALDSDNLVILENINMVEKENQYLRHITTGESKHRVTYFRDFIERKKINYTENLKNIIEEQFDTNLLYSNKKIKSNYNLEQFNKSNKILIYTGFCDIKWNYTYSMNSALGGSERAVINISKYLQKDYDIYIGGDVEEETFEKIRFINEKNLEKLLKENYFQTIIISRFINFFELYPFFKTKKIFIWGHDTNLLSRSMDSQKSINILNKWNSNITNYICLTEWQKQRYENLYPIIKNKIKLINNGINLDLFPKNIIKKRNRFVFTSGPGRGLKKVLELWPEICNKLEDAELKFATYVNFPSCAEDNKMQEIINKYKNIQFMGRLNPNELYELQASSEYWLYPTNFDETSCITALEMLYNEVICVYYPRAGLADTIGEYGIKISEGNEIDSIVNLTEEDKIRIRASGKKYAEECTWENRVKVWSNLIGLHPSCKYVINLERRKDRLELFRSRCTLNDVNIEYGFDGKFYEKELQEDQKIFLSKFKNLKNGEKGCFISHIRLLKKFIKLPIHGDELMIVFEDDAQFCDNFDKKIINIISDINKNKCGITYIAGRFIPDFIMKPENYFHITDNIIEHNLIKYSMSEHDRTTCGYVISKNIAKLLLDEFNKDTIINIALDHWMLKIFRDNNIKIYDSKPLLCYSPWMSESDIR